MTLATYDPSPCVTSPSGGFGVRRPTHARTPGPARESSDDPQGGRPTDTVSGGRPFAFLRFAPSYAPPVSSYGGRGGQA